MVREMRTISGALTPTATYLMGPQGPLYRRDDLTGSLRWYVFDGLGSVVGEVDPSGNLTCNRGYDVYGATRTSTGTPTSKHGFVGQLGHPTDDETSLVYMRARYYDAQIGRFLSGDPGFHGPNWYAYASANPTNRGDRNGRSDETIGSVDAASDINNTLENGDGGEAGQALHNAGPPDEIIGARDDHFFMQLQERLGYNPAQEDIEEMWAQWDPAKALESYSTPGNWVCRVWWRNELEMWLVSNSDGEAVTAFAVGGG